MRIGIDARLFAEGRRSGVEEYAENILKHLFALDSVNDYHLFFNAWQSDTGKKRIESLSRFPNVRLHVLNIPNKILNASLVTVQRPKIDRLLGGVDVFFSPNLMFTALSKHVRHVLTMHDLGFKLYPEFLTLKRRLWHHMVAPKRQVRNAHAIIAVSESTRRDVIAEFGADSAKVHTIHSGLRNLAAVSKEEDALMLAKLGVRPPYILFFATLEPRKNMETLLAAYRRVRQELPETPALVFAGLEGWMTKNIRNFTSHDSKNIVFTGPVSEKEKTVLYRNALCMLYPSIYEGFGFPPLEAMQAGTPVITSNTGSLPEVVGNAALMVDPHNVTALTQAIKSFIEDTELRAWYTKKGKEQIKKFSWQEAAKMTLKVLTQKS